MLTVDRQVVVMLMVAGFLVSFLTQTAMMIISSIEFLRAFPSCQLLDCLRADRGV